MTSNTTAPAAPAPRQFTFQQAYPVRVVVRDDQPWFIAADVCVALGLTNPSMALSGLDSDERAKFNLGRQGDAGIINESGLYTLILRCRDATKPGTLAHRFRKWVTAEVLPAIRKTGRYEAAPVQAPAPLATINAEQRLELRRAVEARVAKIMGRDTRAHARQGEFLAVWRAVHDQFRVSSFIDLPAARFDEAMDFVNSGLLPARGDATLHEQITDMRELLVMARDEFKLVMDKARLNIQSIDAVLNAKRRAVNALPAA